jgi:GDPmannose 4,6-dehydratase
LFHASSSELFKGHGVYEVVDDSTDFHPTTIYGISKQFGHQVVQYYRKKYGLPFSNGILFTTESPLRNHRFVLQKMIRHASSWAQTRQPLALGSVDSYRNLIHASDVASAVAMILKQPMGNEYVISNLEGETIEGVMQKVYQHYGMDLQKQGDSYVDSKTGESVVVIGESLRGSPTHIDGHPDALLKLGWKPMYSLEGLLEDLFV